MFPAIREWLSAFVSNDNRDYIPPKLSARPRTNIRKRRQNINEDNDCILENPVKRHKPIEKNPTWIVNIYEYIIGKTNRNIQRQSTNTRLMSTNHQEKIDEVSLTYTRESHHASFPERKILAPVHKTVISQNRSLSQISNSMILDLTNIDDDDDTQKDIEVTKVTIDLTKQTIPSSLPEVKFSEHQISREPVTVTVKPKHNGQLPSFMMENIRLDEKKRYKEILAQFTNISLPDYSEAILPNPSPVKTKSYSTRPLFDEFSQEENSNDYDIECIPIQQQKKPITIDLTKFNFGAESSKTRSRKYVDLTKPRSSRKTDDLIYVGEELGTPQSNSIIKRPPQSTSIKKSSLSSSRDTLSQSSLNNTPMSFTTSLSFNMTKESGENNSINHSALINSDWLKKIRENLDPIQLAREKRIKSEKRKQATIKKKQLEEIEKLSQKSGDEFPQLTDDMLIKIGEALSPGNAGDVFIEGFNAQITRADIFTLRDLIWLNDEVVNFYFNLVKMRNEENKDLPKVHVFNTFFYPKIVKMGHSGVKRWTRKVDIFAMDLILIPVHLSMHWCLAVIDFKNKEIVYYDSLKGNNLECIPALKKYLQDESKDKKKTVFNFTGWKELMPKNIPEQMNGCDCGVFMCKYAEYKSRYADFTFKQENMPYFRKRMICEILSKKLM